jgi:hypothetical protein
MKTRKMYLQGECTHREYYSQFVTDAIIRIVRNSIGMDAINNSKDEHMNDIPLQLWDRLTHVIHCNFDAAGDFRTNSGCVCVLKEAAKQIKESL